MALLHRRSTSKRASQKMWENNVAMPDDASANDNVSSARPEPAAFVPTPFDEVIDISDLVAERRRLQRNLWAMRIITIVLLIAAIAVACFPLALQFESDRNLAATTATTAKEVAGWPYPQAEDKLTAARAYNKKLAESGQPILGEAVDPFAAAQGGSQASGEDSASKKDKEYQSLLNTGNGVMGTIKVPKQSINLPSHRDTGSSNFALHTFRGAAYSTPDEKYEKYKFDTIADNENLNISSKGGWVAMLQQYFATAWIPHNDGTNNFYTANLGNGIAAIGYKSQPVLVQPGQTGAMNSTLWVGPEIQDKMAAVAPHLDLTVDYGWLWFISQPLFKLLKWIHSFVGNWGFSIIIITFIVRGIMYPLTKAQYTSMAKMRMLQPKIQAMRERLGDDKQRISQEMMALYKAEKVNPLGGCFPLLIQMPIFLALYYMLMGSIELRHAPFALWIHDLSAQDPYYILPILMGVTMFFIQKMSPTTVTDPMQQKIMTFMPVIFTVFFLWFPSGLVLYYIVSNLVTIIQQQLIYRGLEKRGLHSREKKKS